MDAPGSGQTGDSAVAQKQKGEGEKYLRGAAAPVRISGSGIWHKRLAAGSDRKRSIWETLYEGI